eukprot:TRINITY_DN3654_c0_g1_i2.p1 TRINITY_DN3654_c0_g1~~TRINITY_DN3654_c0_g1_i2.p1  ORF type:complete len:269 (-),score=46.27 TRINITY_DN3654_c0_g1_i2:15-821(-)
MKNLQALLRKSAYAGPEREAQIPAAAFLSRTQLIGRVAASEAEVIEALKAMHAFPHQAAWRILEPTYAFAALEYLVTTATQIGMAFDALDPEQLGSAADCEEYPLFVHLHLLSAFTIRSESGNLAFDQRKITRLFAQHLFCSVNPRWVTADFVRALNLHLPSEWHLAPSTNSASATSNVEEHPVFTLLVGLAVPTENNTLRYIDIAALPVQPRERFRELFNIRPKWGLAEILPFLEDIVTPANSAEKLLLSHARRIVVGSSALYCSRE